MRRLLAFLFLLVVAVLAITWYRDPQHRLPGFGRLRHEVKADAERVKQAARREWPKLDVDTERIKQELAQTGRVVRRKAAEAGAKIADVTADARVTTAIKGKLALDRELSAWDVGVNTTDGRVTLSGKVSSPELIGKAIQIAYDTDGVQEVIAVIQVVPQTAEKK
jgi:hyperosmotically inducible protein